MKIPAIKKTYQDQVVLDLPEMEFEEGSVLAIFGANGSGKSTFAKILAGIEQSDDRKIIAPDRTVGYMNQQTLAFRLSVKNNLMQNGDPKRSRSENMAHADLLLEQIGLAADAGKNARKLSGRFLHQKGISISSGTGSAWVTMVWPCFICSHCSLVTRIWRGLEPTKGPTMPISSISSTIRAARA